MPVTRAARAWRRSLRIACAFALSAAIAAVALPAAAQDAVLAAAKTASLSESPIPSLDAPGTLLDDVGTGLKVRSAQTRARQARLNDTQSTRLLPRFESGLTITDDQKSAPLRPNERPGVAPGKLAPNSIGRVNSYLTGDLHSSQKIDNAAGLSTSALTLGADYRFDEYLLVGLAASRLQTAHTAGSTFSAYTSIQPFDALFVDVEMSWGAHRTRLGDEPASALLEPEHEATGTSRGVSLQVHHPGRVGSWRVAPFSRYETIETAFETADGVRTGSTQTLSAVAIGSTLGTTVGTPLGTMRPQLLVELQRESRQIAGGAAAMQTQGAIGLGVATKVTRELSAFAESRYEQELGADAERRAMLGLRLTF
ncbi:MAG: autotransporter outer membrane beta-barrel domain-containing protein [Lautropia sp.]